MDGRRFEAAPVALATDRTGGRRGRCGGTCGAAAAVEQSRAAIRYITAMPNPQLNPPFDPPSNPYQPPAAALRDTLHAPLILRFRSVWLHGGVVVLGVLALLWVQPFVNPVMSTLLIIESMAVTLFMSVVPIRIILAGRTVSPPWWSDALLYLLLVPILLSAFTHDNAPAYLAMIAGFGLNLVCLVALCLTEYRLGLRAYSRGRQWVFVRRDSDEIV
jgi:hypothetical protein